MEVEVLETIVNGQELVASNYPGVGLYALPRAGGRIVCVFGGSVMQAPLPAGAFDYLMGQHRAATRAGQAVIPAEMLERMVGNFHSTLIQAIAVTKDVNILTALEVGKALDGKE